MLKIRLARGGRKKKPVYSIVVADSKSPRDGRFVAKLGQYNPHVESPLIDVKTEEIALWQTKGAQLTDSVRSLLKKFKA
jgi:small subunit ribosomal protein S16